MRKLLLLATIALVCTASMALAQGMNPGGALLLHADEGGLTFCDIDPAQSAYLPETCEELVTRTDFEASLTIPVHWVIVAAFPPDASPALKGVEFGIEHNVEILGNWGCYGDPTLYPGWPASGTGVGFILQAPSYATMTEIMTFAGYCYQDPVNPSPCYFRFIDHPSQGAPKFLDTQVPGQLNEVVYFGELGFFQDGVLNCPVEYVPPAVGACCFPNGSCEPLTEAECGEEGGAVWQGADTVCDPNPCPVPVGACCLPNGSCSDMTEAACTAADGYWRGWAYDCATSNCAIYGACCYVDRNCTFGRQADCPSQDAVWQGAGTVCDPNPCVDPTGVCCTSSGDCSNTYEVQCLPGSWRTWWEGLVCGDVPEDNPCPQIGACCRPEGDPVQWTCTRWIETRCLDASNNPTGENHWIPDTFCTPTDPCQPDPMGACCRFIGDPDNPGDDDWECENLFRSACLANPSNHHYPGMDCEDIECPGPSPTIESTWGHIKSTFKN